MGLYFSRKLSILRRNWNNSALLENFQKKWKKNFGFSKKPKKVKLKVYESVKKIIKDKEIDFFPVLGITFLATLVCPESKSYFENTSTGTCRSMIPRLKVNQKAQIVLNFIYVATSFLQKYKAQLIHLGPKKKSCKYTSVLHRKLDGFVLCVIILIVPNFRKVRSSLINLDFQTFFKETTALISSIRASTKNFTLVQEDWIKKPSFFILVSNSWPSRFSRKTINLDLSRFSNSHFSENTALISSIKISIENLLL